MRNLIARLIVWFARHYGVSLVEHTRLHTGSDAVERGARWEMFYREQGGLADMLETIRREAFEAAAELDPSDTDKIYYWATADRNIRKLKLRIEGVIISGHAEDDRRRALERMSAGQIIR